MAALMHVPSEQKYRAGEAVRLGVIGAAMRVHACAGSTYNLQI